MLQNDKVLEGDGKKEDPWREGGGGILPFTLVPVMSPPLPVVFLEQE